MNRGALRSLKANSGCAGVLFFSLFFFGQHDILSVTSLVHSVVIAFDRNIWFSVCIF